MDAFGIAVHNAIVPGNCYKKAHSKIQYLLRDIFNHSGYTVDLEARLIGKLPPDVQHEYNTAYLATPSDDAIVPDLKVDDC